MYWTSPLHHQNSFDSTAYFPFVANVAVGMFTGEKEVNFAHITRLDDANHQMFLQVLMIHTGQEVASR